MKTYDVIAMEAEVNRLSSLHRFSSSQLIVVDDMMDIAIVKDGVLLLSENYPNKLMVKGKLALVAANTLRKEGKQVMLMTENKFISERVARLNDHLVINRTIDKLASIYIDVYERPNSRDTMTMQMRH